MLSAIISDTILLKSKTTTNEDIDAFNYLTEFTGINSTKYGLEMLIAGTNVSDYSEYDIITVDSKAYTVNGYPIQIANVNSANISEITERKTKLLEEIDKYIKDNNKGVSASKAFKTYLVSLFNSPNLHGIISFWFPAFFK